MKSFFKFILIFMGTFLSINARDIVLITFDDNSYETAKLMGKIIMKEEGIPEKLISYKHLNRPCEKKFLESIIQFCIKNKEAKVLLQDSEIIRNAFEAFKGKDYVIYK